MTTKTATAVASVYNEASVVWHAVNDDELLTPASGTLVQATTQPDKPLLGRKPDDVVFTQYNSAVPQVIDDDFAAKLDAACSAYARDPANEDGPIVQKLCKQAVGCIMLPTDSPLTWRGKPEPGSRVVREFAKRLDAEYDSFEELTSGRTPTARELARFVHLWDAWNAGMNGLRVPMGPYEPSTAPPGTGSTKAFRRQRLVQYIREAFARADKRDPDAVRRVVAAAAPKPRMYNTLHGFVDRSQYDIGKGQGYAAKSSMSKGADSVSQYGVFGWYEGHWSESADKVVANSPDTITLLLQCAGRETHFATFSGRNAVYTLPYDFHEADQKKPQNARDAGKAIAIAGTNLLQYDAVLGYGVFDADTHYAYVMHPRRAGTPQRGPDDVPRVFVARPVSQDKANTLKDGLTAVASLYNAATTACAIPKLYDGYTGMIAVDRDVAFEHFAEGGAQYIMLLAAYAYAFEPDPDVRQATLDAMHARARVENADKFAAVAVLELLAYGWAAPHATFLGEVLSDRSTIGARYVLPAPPSPLSLALASRADDDPPPLLGGEYLRAVQRRLGETYVRSTVESALRFDETRESVVDEWTTRTAMYCDYIWSQWTPARAAAPPYSPVAWNGAWAAMLEPGERAVDEAKRGIVTNPTLKLQPMQEAGTKMDRLRVRACMDEPLDHVASVLLAPFLGYSGVRFSAAEGWCMDTRTAPSELSLGEFFLCTTPLPPNPTMYDEVHGCMRMQRSDLIGLINPPIYEALGNLARATWTAVVKASSDDVHETESRAGTQCATDFIHEAALGPQGEPLASVRKTDATAAREVRGASCFALFVDAVVRSATARGTWSLSKGAIDAEVARLLAYDLVVGRVDGRKVPPYLTRPCTHDVEVLRGALFALAAHFTNCVAVTRGAAKYPVEATIGQILPDTDPSDPLARCRPCDVVNNLVHADYQASIDCSATFARGIEAWTVPEDRDRMLTHAARDEFDEGFARACIWDLLQAKLWKLGTTRLYDTGRLPVRRSHRGQVVKTTAADLFDLMLGLCMRRRAAAAVPAPEKVLPAKRKRGEAAEAPVREPTPTELGFDLVLAIAKRRQDCGRGGSASPLPIACAALSTSERIITMCDPAEESLYVTTATLGEFADYVKNVAATRKWLANVRATVDDVKKCARFATRMFGLLTHRMYTSAMHMMWKYASIGRLIDPSELEATVHTMVDWWAALRGKPTLVKTLSEARDGYYGTVLSGAPPIADEPKMLELADPIDDEKRAKMEQAWRDTALLSRTDGLAILGATSVVETVQHVTMVDVLTELLRCRDAAAGTLRLALPSRIEAVATKAVDPTRVTGVLAALRTYEATGNLAHADDALQRLCDAVDAGYVPGYDAVRLADLVRLALRDALLDAAGAFAGFTETRADAPGRVVVASRCGVADGLETRMLRTKADVRTFLEDAARAVVRPGALPPRDVGPSNAVRVAGAVRAAVAAGMQTRMAWATESTLSPPMDTIEQVAVRWDSVAKRVGTVTTTVDIGNATLVAGANYEKRPDDERVAYACHGAECIRAIGVPTTRAEFVAIGSSGEAQALRARACAVVRWMADAAALRRTGCGDAVCEAGSAAECLAFAPPLSWSVDALAATAEAIYGRHALEVLHHAIRADNDDDAPAYAAELVDLVDWRVMLPIAKDLGRDAFPGFAVPHCRCHDRGCVGGPARVHGTAGAGIDAVLPDAVFGSRPDRVRDVAAATATGAAPAAWGDTQPYAIETVLPYVPRVLLATDHNPFYHEDIAQTLWRESGRTQRTTAIGDEFDAMHVASQPGVVALPFDVVETCATTGVLLDDVTPDRTSTSATSVVVKNTKLRTVVVNGAVCRYSLAIVLNVIDVKKVSPCTDLLSSVSRWKVDGVHLLNGAPDESARFDAAVAGINALRLLDDAILWTATVDDDTFDALTARLHKQTNKCKTALPTTAVKTVVSVGKVATTTTAAELPATKLLAFAQRLRGTVFDQELFGKHDPAMRRLLEGQPGSTEDLVATIRGSLQPDDVQDRTSVLTALAVVCLLTLFLPDTTPTKSEVVVAMAYYAEALASRVLGVNPKLHPDAFNQIAMMGDEILACLLGLVDTARNEAGTLQTLLRSLETQEAAEERKRTVQATTGRAVGCMMDEDDEDLRW